MSKDAAELSAAVQGATLQRQLVECNPQIVAEDARSQGANMAGEAEAPSPAAESGYDCQWHR